eukprot:Skav220512  [mRNA]  locus=scaffold279:162219:165592:- [translate_table: standard]
MGERRLSPVGAGPRWVCHGGDGLGWPWMAALKLLMVAFVVSESFKSGAIDRGYAGLERWRRLDPRQGTRDGRDRHCSFKQVDCCGDRELDEGTALMPPFVGICQKGLKPNSPNQARMGTGTQCPVQDAWSVVRVEDHFSIYSVYDGHGPYGTLIMDGQRLRQPQAGQLPMAFVATHASPLSSLPTNGLPDATYPGHDVANLAKDILPCLLLEDDRLTGDVKEGDVKEMFMEPRSAAGAG